MCMQVCLSLCVCASGREHISETMYPIFTKFAAILTYFGDAVSCVLSVLWMISTKRQTSSKWNTTQKDRKSNELYRG